MFQPYLAGKCAGGNIKFECKKALGFLAVMLLCTSLVFTTQNNASAISIADGLVENPTFQQYLRDVQNGNGDDWEIIPDQYIPASSGALEGRGAANGLPTSYNLVTAGYGTTQKNQGGDNICWAYATTTAMESYLKKTKGVSIEFSSKQLDYLTASTTPYGQLLKNSYNISRNVGGAGNFNVSAVGLKSEYAPDTEASFFARMKANDSDLKNYGSFKHFNDYGSIFPFGVYAKNMSYEQILGEKSGYVVDGTKILLGGSTDVVEKIKQTVYTNGAVYVGTYAPGTDGCWDDTTKTVIDKGSTVCDAKNAHAMAIVGWDDNYSYSDGTSGGSTKGAGDTKTGAFILQNSYGKSSLFKDYNLTVDKIIEIYNKAGALDGKTADEIAELKRELGEEIALYDANEYVHLGYDFSDETNFGIITSMTTNSYEDVLDVTEASVKANDSKFEFSFNNKGEKLIKKIGVDLVLGNSAELTIGIDNNNDGKSDYTQVAQISADDSIGRIIINLNEPVLIDGNFKIILSAKINNNEIVFRDGDEKYISVLAYMEGAGEEDLPVPNTASEIEDEVEIVVPNTGNFTGGENGLAGGIIVSFMVIVTLASGITLYKNKDIFHKVGFNKK